MAIETTYSRARANFASLWDRVVQDRETVVIKRRGTADVALIAADELSGLLETEYLLRSPENARRLLQALTRAQEGTEQPSSLEELRRELGVVEQR